MSGDLGRTKTGGRLVSYSTKAILAQTNFKASDSWTLGLDAGQVNGHDGSSSKFGALYLNPNYQVANLLYRYNIGAIGNNGANVYDSYITNSMYFKLRSSYSTDKWVFDSPLFMQKLLKLRLLVKQPTTILKIRSSMLQQLSLMTLVQKLI